MESLHTNKEHYVCLMTSLYQANFISEMICLNQYFSFCSYDDVEVMLKDHDFDNACIYFLSDIPLLEILIKLYSQRRTISKDALEVSEVWRSRLVDIQSAHGSDEEARNKLF